jgi:hypothetical protein
VRHQATAGFDAALAKLPREHRRLFIDAARAHLIPALAAGSFSGPDGRALFTIGPDSDGEPLLTWLAIGYHDIYH